MQSRALLGILLAFSVLPWAQGAPVYGKAALSAKAAALESTRATGDAPIATVRLRPLAVSKLSAESRDGDKAMRVGLARDVAGESETGLSSPTLTWRPTADGAGWAARVALSSPGASALRLGVRLSRWPEGLELRAYPAANPARVTRMDAGSMRQGLREQGLAWTPVTEGDAQAIEVFVPGATAPRGVSLEIASASHLVVSPSQLKASGVGASDSCQKDVACVAPQDPAVARNARSVTKLLYTRNGASYVCTGTLVNDGTTGQVPYVYTAAHCIDSPAVAATLNTFWFFEATGCGNGAPGAYTQLSGGATLLYADAEGDAALVKLSDPAPAGAWFSGWDDAPLVQGTSILGLHHPRGDLKKVSRGVLPAQDDDVYTTVAWTQGTTEPGSSGSGLFTASGGEYLLRGGLRGGPASCTSSGNVASGDNRDIFSRLDLAAPKLAPWIKASAAIAAPGADYSGMWYDPAEPGWGLTVTQKGNRAMVTWYTYDADGIADWLIVPEVTWRGPASLEGSLTRASGSPALGAYDGSRFKLNAVGSVAMSFDGTTGSVTIVVDGKTLVKPLRKLDP